MVQTCQWNPHWHQMHLPYIPMSDSCMIPTAGYRQESSFLWHSMCNVEQGGGLWLRSVQPQLEMIDTMSVGFY